MATSAPGLQLSVASSSQPSSRDKKTSAEWKRYFEVLLERKKAADNVKGKGKPADWWQYLAVIHSCTGAADFETRCGGLRTRCAHPFGARTQAMVRYISD
ncbi:TPA: hypothetical protein ACH3X1_002835 [Trebouxia sp. C0004]